MNRIGLSLEIPSSLLKTLSPMTDLDFALAHRVLEDEHYARFYASRELGRELLLDNSMHELGTPLKVEDLHEAAKRVHADYVVAPDLLDEPEKNLQWFEETYEAMGDEFRIAVCASGRTPDERAVFLDHTKRASMLCMPYRVQRLGWFLENPPKGQRVHLLGMSTLVELRAWTTLVQQFPTVKFSVDTSKPVKAALVGRSINDGASLRGIPISSKDLLGLTSFTPVQMVLLTQNIQDLSRLLRGAL